MKYQDPLIGRRLGSFRIERLLGRGGMARVYYGWDENLERPVAVKVVDERYRGEPAYDERFLREARAVAAMQHPNILQIYQAGEDQGISYYAMEYIRGLDVGQIIRKYAAAGERMPYADVLRIGRAVANALDYAHRRGIIHRDVKPSNVLVAEDGRVVLTDFGLAMNIHQGTRGEVFGSPLYISPEQARGSAHVVPESDLYSLGVMLYEMLTGSLPFEDDSPAALALKHVNQPPPSPRMINPALSSEVDRVLLKALSKSSESRYRSGSALIDALEKALYAPSIEKAPETQPMPVEAPDISSYSRPTPVSRVSVDQRVAQHLEERPPLPDFPATERNPEATLPSLLHFPLARPSFGWGRIFRVWLTCGVLQLLCVLSVIAALEFGLLNGRASPGEGGVLPPESEISSGGQESTPPPSAAGSQSTNPVLSINLLVATQKDESLFVVNAGNSGMPLEGLSLGNDQGEVTGSEWGVEVLNPGECVGVLQENGNPDLPDKLECQEVGERLLREGKDKFWSSDYNIFYAGTIVGDCKKHQKACQVQFDLEEISP